MVAAVVIALARGGVAVAAGGVPAAFDFALSLARAISTTLSFI